jgi:branched-chain amino acid transport system substrate-binding protein
MRKLLAIFIAVLVTASFILAGCSTSTPTATTSVPTPSSTTAAPPPSSTTAPPSTTTSAPPTTTTTAPPTTSTTPVSTTPIKIGGIVSLTGQSSQTGPPERAALQWRLNQIGNQIAGRPIQLIVDDDASSPTTVIDAVKKQLLSDKVDVIIGPTMGSAAVAAGNFMKTANPAVPILITMAKSGKVLQGATNNNVFLPMGTDVSTGYYTGLYEYDKLGYKTTTAILEDMVSGWDKVGAAETAFKKEGGTVVQEQKVPSGTVDFSSYLAGLQPADSVTVWLTPGLMAKFVAAYFTSGKTMPLVIPDASVLFSQTMTSIGDKTLGIVAEVNYTTLIDTQMNKDWVVAYTKDVGYVPTIQAAATDQSLLAYLEAVKATNGDTTPAKINAALRKISIDTPAGPISFTASGMGIGNLYIAKSVRVGDRIDWQVLDSYKNIVLDQPAN